MKNTILILLALMLTIGCEKDDKEPSNLTSQSFHNSIMGNWFCLSSTLKSGDDFGKAETNYYVLLKVISTVDGSFDYEYTIDEPYIRVLENDVEKYKIHITFQGNKCTWKNQNGSILNLVRVQ